MNLPRPVPKRVFQAVALVALVPTFALVAEVVVRDLPPYSWIADVTGSSVLAAVFTLFVGVLLWVATILPVRLLSTMPTLQEELDANQAGGLGELYAQQQEKLTRARAGTDHPSQATWHGMMALGGGLVALVSSVATIAAWVELGRVPVVVVALALVSAPLALYHLARFLIALVRRVGRVRA